METGYVYSNGVRLYYEMIGQGAPLLLLNGGPGFSHDYLQELRVLAPYANLVFFDQRGTGQSDRVDAQGYTIDANVEDVENLREALQLGPCGVLGHSWGGMLAQAYVLKYPQHATRLILADTFSSIADCNTVLARMRAAMPAETQAIYERYEREGLYKAGDRYPDEYQAALDRAYEPVYISVPPPDYLQATFSKISYEVYRTMWGEETEFRVTGTLAAFDVADRLGAIRVPALVIAGTSDMPTVAMAAATARAIPHARLEIFAHSRHFPFIEEPAKFLRVVSEFLEETSPADV